jgi:DNA-binding beta-propeller fold protein YncE
MRILSFFILPLALAACIGPFAGNKSEPWLDGPPALVGRFDSETATVHLRWPQGDERGFLRYKIQRQEGGEFVDIADVGARLDTAYADERLEANLTYRYRVISYFGSGDRVHELQSTVVDGIFHRYVNSWRVETGFAPTRIAVSSGGTVYVVGAGSGRVERFDRAGNPLGALVYAEGKLACMETSTLDAPSLALDKDDNLYIVYNLLRAEGGPKAYWSKFDSDSQLVWTRPLDGLFARHIVVDGDDVFIESISQLQHLSRDGERHTQYLIPALLVSSLRMWQGRFAALIEPVSLLDSDWQTPRLVVYDNADRQSTRLVIGRDAKSNMDRGPGVLRRPTDFVVDEVKNRAFVVNAGQNRIEVFRDERFSTRWGRVGDAPGQFRFSGEVEVVDEMTSGRTSLRSVVAGGIARDNEGYIYVADTFNDRIQKFRP